MIRIVILIIGIAILWVLFLSKFSKQEKIKITAAAVAIALLGLWLAQDNDILKSGLIEPSEIANCGIKGEYSYRTNYQIDYCLKNNSTTATTNRIELQFAAMDCTSGDCAVLDSVSKEFQLKLIPDQQRQLSINLAFNNLARQTQQLTWQVKVLSVKAVR